MAATKPGVRKALDFLLVAILAGAALAACVPLVYLVLQLDIYGSLGLDEGIGKRKWFAYKIFLFLTLLCTFGLLVLTRKPRTWWIAVSLAWGFFFATTLGAHYATEFNLDTPSSAIAARNKHTIVTPTIPSLRAVYSDKSWRSKIDSFRAFQEQAELRYLQLQPELKSAGLGSEEARIVAYMLFVSSLWEYGNATQTDLPGCVCTNEDNDWNRIPEDQMKAETYANSRIGCCTDYAYILKRIFNDAKIKSRLTTIPGHIFNEVQIHDRWYSVDANANLFIDCEWSEAGPSRKMRIYQFVHPGGMDGEQYRPQIPTFQAIMLNRAVLELTVPVQHPELPSYIANAP